jgi:hypothetical protein
MTKHGSYVHSYTIKGLKDGQVLIKYKIYNLKGVPYMRTGSKNEKKFKPLTMTFCNEILAQNKNFRTKFLSHKNEKYSERYIREVMVKYCNDISQKALSALIQNMTLQAVKEWNWEVRRLNEEAQSVNWNKVQQNKFIDAVSNKFADEFKSSYAKRLGYKSQELYTTNPLIGDIADKFLELFHPQMMYKSKSQKWGWMTNDDVRTRATEISPEIIEVMLPWFARWKVDSTKRTRSSIQEETTENQAPRPVTPIPLESPEKNAAELIPKKSQISMGIRNWIIKEYSTQVEIANAEELTMLTKKIASYLFANRDKLYKHDVLFIIKIFSGKLPELKSSLDRLFSNQLLQSKLVKHLTPQEQENMKKVIISN